MCTEAKYIFRFGNLPSELTVLFLPQFMMVVTVSIKQISFMKLALVSYMYIHKTIHSPLRSLRLVSTAR